VNAHGETEAGGDPIDTHPVRLMTRRLATRPDIWPRLRADQRRWWAHLAPTWDAHLRPDHLAPLAAALEWIPPPARALDLCTGSGAAARLLAERYRTASVVAIDFSADMIGEARRLTRGLGIRYRVGDAAALPFGAEAFDLIVAVNAFVFWNEVTRVLAAGGALVIEYSNAEQTPIYLPPDEVKQHLLRTGNYAFQDGRSGRGVWILAHKRDAI
jgi:SAM-dependent methyltransferase